MEIFQSNLPNAERGEVMRYSFLVFVICQFIINLNFNKSIKSFESDIKESRHREDLLLQEVKNLDYEISVLAGLSNQAKNLQ